jgi:hypothetical protein
MPFFGGASASPPSPTQTPAGGSPLAVSGADGGGHVRFGTSSSSVPTAGSVTTLARVAAGAVAVRQLVSTLLPMAKAWVGGMAVLTFLDTVKDKVPHGNVLAEIVTPVVLFSQQHPVYWHVLMFGLSSLASYFFRKLLELLFDLMLRSAKVSLRFFFTWVLPNALLYVCFRAAEHLYRNGTEALVEDAMRYLFAWLASLSFLSPYIATLETLMGPLTAPPVVVPEVTAAVVTTAAAADNATFLEQLLHFRFF